VPTPEPFERQPGEPTKAYSAFTVYRNTPAQERSLRRVTSEVGHTHHKQVETWSVRWGWKARADAWDDYQDERQRQAFLKERETMGRRHARSAEALMNALMLPAQVLAEKLQKNPDAALAVLKEMDAAELLELIVQSSRVFQPLMNAERLARGEAVAPVVQVNQTFVSLEADRRERLEKLMTAFQEIGVDPVEILGQVVEVEAIEVASDDD
jgi:hypothetical protein